MSSDQTVLCRYHYDPLDRLAGHATASESDIRLFYQKSRLATQIQGALHRSILQVDDQLLAQQQSSGKAVETALLATDQQRSVLQSMGASQREASAYTAYGHLPMSSGLSRLLGFDGERRDPLTGHYLLGSGYRAFNPVLMRFNSPDSLSPFGEGGLNAYAYCQGDPVNYRDSTGRMKVPVMADVSEILRVKFSITDPIKRLQSSVLKKPKPLTIKPTSGVATEAGERSVSTVSTPVAALPSAPQAGSPVPSRIISTGFSSTTDKAAAEGSSRLIYYDDAILSSMSDSNYVSHIKGNMNVWRAHGKASAVLAKDDVTQENYYRYMLKAYEGRYGRTLKRKTLSDRRGQIRRNLKRLADQ